MSSIDPSLDSDEPTDEASNYADKVRELWDAARLLALPLSLVFRELKSLKASEPRSGSEVFSRFVAPDEWLDIILDLRTADFTGCWDDDAAAFDKQALANTEQAAAELREDR